MIRFPAAVLAAADPPINPTSSTTDLKYSQNFRNVASKLSVLKRPLESGLRSQPSEILSLDQEQQQQQ
jgi:hypothetical protein